MENHPTRPVIAHYHPVWLPMTMTWLYQSLCDLQSYCDNMVLCEHTVHLNRFAWDDLYDFSGLSNARRLYQRLLKKSGWVQALPFYVQSLNSGSARLLHSHFGHIAVAGSRMAGEAGIPHVASFYGMDVHRIPATDRRWKLWYREMFDNTERIFCEGPHMAENIEKGGCPVEKIRIHPLGVDLEKVSFHPRSWEPGETVRILIAASFREKKGIPLALEALAAIARQYQIHITVAGEATPEKSSQMEKHKIREVIRKQHLNDVVDMCGYVPHAKLLELAKSHHIFLSPSRHAGDGDNEGGAPVGIIEMSASGMMVVSTRHCDIPEVIRHRQTGWLAEENNLEDLIKQLRSAIDSHSEWYEMAGKAREHISKYFDAQTQAKKLFRHYLEVTGENES